MNKGPTNRELAQDPLSMAMLLSNLPGMAYRCVNDQHWTMRFVSDGCQALTGYPPEDLLGNSRVSYDGLIDAEDRDAVHRDVADAVAQRRPYRLVYRIRTAEGAVKWVWEQGMPLFGEETLLEGFICDISDRVRAETALRRSSEELQSRIQQRTDELRQSEVRFRGLIENLPDLVMLMEPSSRVVFVNRPAMLGPDRQLLGELGVEWVDPASRPAARAALDAVLAESSVRRVELKTLLGHWWDCRLVPLPEGQRPLAMVICTDVTEQKTAQEALIREQQLLRRLLELNERERQLVAYEIHDGLAQQLTGASFTLQGYAERRDKESEAARKELAAALELLNGGIDESRRLIGNLRPPVLDEMGIVMAIEYLLAEARRRGAPAVFFRAEVEFDRLPPPLENTLFRIVQEALNNAVRHAAAERIDVDLKQDGGRLKLLIVDDGRGFHLDEVPDDRFGLRSIRERARLMGGRARIESQPGRGAVVDVELPVVDPVGS